MARYHINKKTGKAGVCKPKKTGICGLQQDGQEEPQHYGSLREAEEAHASNTVGAEHGKTTSFSKKSLDTVTLEENAGIISKHNLENMLERNGLSNGNSEVWLVHDSQTWLATVEGRNNATLTVTLGSDLTNIGEAKREIASTLNEFDAEDEFDEIWSDNFGEHNGFTAPQFLKMLEEDEEQFKKQAKQWKREEDQYMSSLPTADEINSAHETDTAPSPLLEDSYSEVPNNQVVTEDNLASMIEDYDLDYGNAETYIQDGSMFANIEAPSHATINVEVPEGATGAEARKIMLERISEFNPDAEFEEIWTPEFGEHNGFSPRGFLDSLREDKNYFDDVARYIKQDRKNLD